MKKFTSLLLILCAWAMSLHAYDFKSNGIRYDIVSSSSKTVQLASSTQSAGSDGAVAYSGDVTIPESVTYNGTTYTVVGIGQSAFINCAGVTSVKLPSTLTYIRKEAFNVCFSLEEIEIPASVTSIGYDVFGVTSVKKIIVKSSTPASVDYNAFYYPQENNNCVLYVPSGSKSKYQNASEWNKFKTIIEQGPEPGMLDGHEYVDLGLPSGRVWATTNYGASSASGYGSYLEWSQRGNVASSWGSNWRTPSRTEMLELVNNCTWTWTSKDGINGFSVTGTNGNSIFMPAAGFKMTMGGGAQSLGKQAYYWTTTSGESGFAYALCGSSSSSANVSTTWNTDLMMCCIRPCADKVQTTIMVSSLALNVSSLSLEEGQSSSLTATVSPSNATNKTLSWSSSNTAVATVSNGEVKAISAGTATITVKATDGSNVSAKCQISVKKAASSEDQSEGVVRLWYNGKYQEIPTSQLDSITFAYGTIDNPNDNHEYVDLGLPSGLKWATCNVGATTPEEYGDYFAWGETTPKTTYSWDTYFDSVNGSSSNFKKYYNNGGKTTLDPEDDAATANWGGSWRMPTKAEQDELRDKCTWTWTTQNNVKGYKVKGPNGNSVFLPAAGYRYLGDLANAGSYGYYWSSSLDTSYSDRACCLYFGSSGVDWLGSYRCRGRSVRPVCQ